jgi:hypothetical protein
VSQVACLTSEVCFTVNKSSLLHSLLYKKTLVPNIREIRQAVGHSFCVTDGRMNGHSLNKAFIPVKNA